MGYTGLERIRILHVANRYDERGELLSVLPLLVGQELNGILLAYGRCIIVCLHVEKHSPQLEEPH